MELMELMELVEQTPAVPHGGTGALYKGPVPSSPSAAVPPGQASSTRPSRLRITLTLLTPHEDRDRSVRRLRAALKGLARCFGLRCIRCDFHTTSQPAAPEAEAGE